MIADVALPSENIETYNQMEKLRDPSHTSALSYETWEELLNDSGLKDLQRGSYKVQMELEKQLNASFPNPGDDKKIREMVRKDVGVNMLGLNAHLMGDEIRFSYPISIYVGTKIG